MTDPLIVLSLSFLSLIFSIYVFVRTYKRRVFSGGYYVPAIGRDLAEVRAQLSEAWAINDQLTDAARLARSMAFQEAAHIIQEQIDSLGGGLPFPYASMERDQVGPHLEGLIDEILELAKPPTVAAQEASFPYGHDFAQPYQPGNGRSAYDGRTLYEQARIYLAAMGIDGQAAHDAANSHISQYGNDRLPPECLDVVVGIMMRHGQP